MRKTIITVLMACATVFQTYAQDEAFGWLGRENNPVYSAMSGASMVSSSDISYAAFHNPAAMPYSSDKFGIGASYCLAAKPEFDKGFISAGAGFRIGKRVGLSVAANYNIGAEYEQMDEFGNNTGSFRTSSMLFVAGIGVKAIDMLSFGVNFKYALERLQPEDNPGAFASDIYALFKWKGLGVAAGVANLGTKVRDASGASYSLPASGRVGVGYADEVAARHFVEANLDADCYFSGAFSAAAGVQYGWNDLLFVRAGYRYATGTCVLPSSASAGLGVKFFGVKIDAAYFYIPSISQSRISVGISYSL